MLPREPKLPQLVSDVSREIRGGYEGLKAGWWGLTTQPAIMTPSLVVGSAQRALANSRRTIVKTAPTGELHMTPLEGNALEQGFPPSALLIFGARQLFVVGDSPMRCRMFGRTPGLYPLDTSSTLSHPTPAPELWVVTMKNVPRYCQMSFSLPCLGLVKPSTWICLLHF